jgi:hypothetical protein
MVHMQDEIDVAAPADRVWEVLGRNFAQVDGWASAIVASVAVTGPGAPDGAPVAGRVCRTGIRMVPEVSERLTAWDDAGMTLSYSADSLPGFLAAATNRWRIVPTGPDRCRVVTEATIEPRGMVGRLLLPLLRVRLARTGGRYLDDLRVMAETGRPSSRKRARAR